MPALPAPYWGGSWPTKHSAPSGAGLSRKAGYRYGHCRALLNRVLLCRVWLGEDLCLSTVIYDLGLHRFSNPTFFLTAIIAVEIVGGLGLSFNVWTSYVAVALIVFLIFATVTIHARFVRDLVSGTDQIVHMIKNIAIIGGLLNFVAS